MSRLSRWSRLKTESRKRRGAALPGFAPEPEEDVPVAAPAPDPVEMEPPEAASTVAPEEEAELETNETEEAYPEDLPPIESLDKDSDYSIFMSDKVSDAIRNRALRKLWPSDPVLANLDGLVDYGEDFTDAATVVANMKSVYQVGRGMVDYEAEEKKKAEMLAKAQEDAVPSDDDDQEVPGDGASELVESPEQEEDLSETAEVDAEEDNIDAKEEDIV